jgi:hypothetical protein
MGRFIKLRDLVDERIRRGSIFRTKAKWPYEDVVDFMVIQTYDSTRPYGLIVSSGYKAGLTLVHLPIESLADDRMGLSTRWIRENWQHWIYPDSAVVDVYFSKGYKSSLFMIEIRGAR